MTPGACFHWHLQSGLLQFGASSSRCHCARPFSISPSPALLGTLQKPSSVSGTSRTLVQPRATYRTHLRAEALLLHGDGSAPWDWLPPCLCDGLSIAVLCCAGQRPYAREAAGCAVVLASPFLCDPTLEPLRDVHSVASSAPVCSKDCRKQCSRKPYRRHTFSLSTEDVFELCNSTVLYNTGHIQCIT